MMPRCAANNLAEFDLGRDVRRGKVLYMTAKYWLGFLHMDGEGRVRIDKNGIQIIYRWRHGQRNRQISIRIYLAYSSIEQYKLCKIIKERCNDIQR
jgi:hypothetical protein